MNVKVDSSTSYSSQESHLIDTLALKGMRMHVCMCLRVSKILFVQKTHLTYALVLKNMCLCTLAWVTLT